MKANQYMAFKIFSVATEAKIAGIAMNTTIVAKHFTSEALGVNRRFDFLEFGLDRTAGEQLFRFRKAVFEGIANAEAP